jgi:hypothetical protein
MAAFPLCVTHNRRVFKNTYVHFEENLVVYDELCIVSAAIKVKVKVTLKEATKPQRR